MLIVAREVIEKLIDDLDGDEAAETVPFALDGTSYEIDLSTKNAAAFRKDLGRYISAARHQGASRSTPRRRTSKATGNRAKPKRDFDVAQLRKWAGANAVEVPSRGRIPQDVVEEYKAAGRRLAPAVKDVVGLESVAAVPDAVAGGGPAVDAAARRYPHRSPTARPGTRSVRVASSRSVMPGSAGDVVESPAMPFGGTPDPSLGTDGLCRLMHEVLAIASATVRLWRTRSTRSIRALPGARYGWQTSAISSVAARSRDMIRSLRRRSDDAGAFLPHRRQLDADRVIARTGGPPQVALRRLEVDRVELYADVPNEAAATFDGTDIVSSPVGGVRGGWPVRASGPPHTTLPSRWRLSLRHPEGGDDGGDRVRVVGLGVLDDPQQRASRQAVVVPPLVHDQRMQLHDESPRAADAVRVQGPGSAGSIMPCRGRWRPGSVALTPARPR